MFNVKKDEYHFRVYLSQDGGIMIEFGENPTTGTIIHVCGDTIEDALINLVKMHISLQNDYRSLIETMKIINTSMEKYIGKK